MQYFPVLSQSIKPTLEGSLPIIMISVKCMIAGIGRGWNPMQRLSLCAMLNDRAYINMKSIQLSLMELSSVILYPVISAPWAEPWQLQLWVDFFLFVLVCGHAPPHISAWIRNSYYQSIHSFTTTGNNWLIICALMLGKGNISDATPVWNCWGPLSPAPSSLVLLFL